MSITLILFLLYTFVFIIGAVVGSFLNVVVYRLPLKISVAKGRSFCPNCGKPIAAYDNIPLFSFLVLRGKCRKCGVPIARRYFITELITGLLALLMVWRFGFDARALLSFVVATILLVITLIDWDTMTIPNGLVIALILPAAASFFVFLEPPIISRAIGIFCVALPMFLMAVFIPGSFGGGDVKLMAVAGFMLGWECTLLATFIGVVLGGVAAIVKLVRKDPDKHMAFGPYLSMGILVSLLWGSDIIVWYWGLFGL